MTKLYFLGVSISPKDEQKKVRFKLVSQDVRNLEGFQGELLKKPTKYEYGSEGLPGKNTAMTSPTVRESSIGDLNLSKSLSQDNRSWYNFSLNQFVFPKLELELIQLKFKVEVVFQ